MLACYEYQVQGHEKYFKKDWVCFLLDTLL